MLSARGCCLNQGFCQVLGVLFEELGKLSQKKKKRSTKAVLLRAKGKYMLGMHYEERQ